MQQPADVLERMQHSSRGWRCARCFRNGKIEQQRSDGTPLSDADRCAGCGETICDRRHFMRPGIERGGRHGVDDHVAASYA